MAVQRGRAIGGEELQQEKGSKREERAEQRSGKEGKGSRAREQEEQHAEHERGRAKQRCVKLGARVGAARSAMAKAGGRHEPAGSELQHT